MTLLAFLALITLSSTARTSIASETDPAGSLRSSFLQLKANPNWILNRAAKFLRGGDRQTTVDFLLGFFVEIYRDGTIIDHNEFTPCVQPDDELHNLAQNLVASAVSLDTSSFDDYHSKISANSSAFGQSFADNVVRNCPGTEELGEAITHYFDDIANGVDDYLSQTWDENQSLVDAYFAAFAGSIKSNDYKHAHAHGVLAIF